MDPPGLPTQIFCRHCGGAMPPADRCPHCGWIDRLGQIADASRVRSARSPPPTIGGAEPLAAPAAAIMLPTPRATPLSTADRRPIAGPTGTLTPRPAGLSQGLAGPMKASPDPPSVRRAIPPGPLAGPRPPPLSPPRAANLPTFPATRARPPSPGPGNAGLPVPPVRPANPSAALARPIVRTPAHGPGLQRANGPATRSPSPKGPNPIVRGLRTIWKRHLPPVRLVWIFLAVLLWNGHGLRNFATAEPLLMLPAVAVFADLGFQAARFPRIRIPDAALANGFFLTVILWPTTVSVTLVAVAVVTVGLRHALRIASHPIFNPAAAGVLVAATVFALPQPWHVGATWTDSALVGVLGLILWSKAWPTWRIWGAYFVANAVAVALIADLLAGGRAVAGVLETSVFAATPIFFGLFMVTEPRTAPTARWGMWLFGGLVGSAAAVLPAVFAELPAYSALGVLAPYLALFVGNVVTAALPSARGVHRPTPRPAQGTGPRRAATPGSEPS